MLFNSFSFLVFFPLVCLGYYIIPYRFRYLFLLGASYYFYMCWNPKYALLMLLSTTITYFSGMLIGKADELSDNVNKEKIKKLVVAGSFLLNLSILFFYKYFNFTVDSINRILSIVHIQPISVGFDVLLPVGISFYTFQALSYTMDVYRKEIYWERNFLKYALFVSFFPQLVAGPIERSKNLLKQLSVKHPLEFSNIQLGFSRMVFGFFQKLVIADNVSVIVSRVYEDPGSFGSVELIFATILFAFQIYCDFGGYSNIAIGASKMMGIDLMENFNAPYLAGTVAEFWRRWHISLTSWFRDYLYIPLGGNRKGKVRKYINILIVFLVSGLWHGASWHFVVWGGLNGIYQIIGDILRPVRRKVCEALKIERKAFSHKLLKVIVTFILVDISWIFFRASSINAAFVIIKRMLLNRNPWALFDGSLYKLGLSELSLHVVFFAILVLAVMDVVRYLKGDFVSLWVKQGIWFRYGTNLLLLMAILIFGYYGTGFDAGQFIYFQF